MIIDAILDRKDGCKYNEHSFSRYCSTEIEIFKMNYSFTNAILDGDEEKAKSELCRYIDEQGYNPDVKNYINSVQWALPALSENEKYDYIINYVVNEQYCLWDIFVDNIGGESKIKKDLQRLKTRKDIKKYVNNYI